MRDLPTRQVSDRPPLGAQGLSFPVRRFRANFRLPTILDEPRAQ
jgi:hypothetical protein